MEALNLVDAMLARLASTSSDPKWMTDDLEAIRAALVASPPVSDPMPGEAPQHAVAPDFETMAILQALVGTSQAAGKVATDPAVGMAWVNRVANTVWTNAPADQKPNVDAVLKTFKTAAQADLNAGNMAWIKAGDDAARGAIFIGRRAAQQLAKLREDQATVICEPRLFMQM